MNSYAIRGLLIGLVAAFVVWLIERTTPQTNWLLIASFPVCWMIAGAMFGRWDREINKQ